MMAPSRHGSREQWEDNSMGIRRIRRRVAGPRDLQPISTPLAITEPLPADPGALTHIPRAPMQDTSLADFPTSKLERGQIIPTWRAQPLGLPEGGRQMYNLDERCRPGVAGFNGMHAELNSGGGGNLYRIWTIGGRTGPETPPAVAFPISLDQIINLLPAAMHARLSEHKFQTFEVAFSKLMEWALADTPDDKEGA